MSNKQTLNDIINNFQDVESKLIETEGAISDEIENKLIKNESDLSEKLDGYEKFTRYLKGQIEYLKTIEYQYSQRRKILENSFKKCKEKMLNSLIVTGNNKIKTLEFNFTIGETEKWDIDINILDDEIKNFLIDNNLAANIFKPNINDIKLKYKDLDKPLWLIIEKNKHLRVK